MSSNFYHGLPIKNLKEVLSTFDLPSGYDLDQLSSKWRCVVVSPKDVVAQQKADASEEQTKRLLEEEEAEALQYLERGMPFLLSRVRAQAAYDKCGPDAIDFITNEKWNTFAKDQIAVKNGWGSAGTTLETSRFHTLIHSFSEVFDHSQRVEVPLTEEERREAKAAAAEEDDVDLLEEKQKSQKSDTTTGAPSTTTTAAAAAEPEVDVEAVAPPLRPQDIIELQLFQREEVTTCPSLGQELVWPDYLENSVICDTATCVSQRGCMRWWHLNDCGEFAHCAALPLRAKEGVAVPVKLFLCGPKGSYDWFLHDAEASVGCKVTALDLFRTPDEALPKDATLLPILTVAVLYAGGQTLLMPPNTPYMSLALVNSVVVEQRRLGNLWLDEVSYYLHRVTQWRTNPIFYDYLDTDLQDENYIASQLIPLLLEVFRLHGNATTFDHAIRRRVAASLLALATQEKHYKLSEGTRASVQALLRGGEDGAIAALLQEPWPCLTTALRAKSPSSSELPIPSVQQYLEDFYWQTGRYWPKSGCVMHPPVICAPQLYSDALQEQCQEELAATGVLAGGVFLPVVYAQSRPIYGTEASTLQATVSEYFSMKDLEGQRKELLTFLRSRKAEHDDLLDELF